MNWSRVRLIFHRELRDQVRDRRTMFTIFVLPLLLYPFLGMLMLQVAQFHSEHPVKITWIGQEHWPEDRPLQSKESESKSQIAWTVQNADEAKLFGEQLHNYAQDLVRNGHADLVFITVAGFAEALNHRSQSLPLTTVTDQASDQSGMALRRLNRLLDDWQRDWLREKIAGAKLDPSILKPLQTYNIDIAPKETKQALVWAKLLPLIMLVWALTGAFYPAIDLCAGEKERGTLETLLSSPATRREIVWGKLFTVMTFSMATAVLNLFSMQFTSSFVISQFAKMGTVHGEMFMGPLPLSALTWLIMILLPISIMFSALALAVASLARSSKEGQYYLMPLLFVGLPLVMLPMMPGLSLSAGSSAIPVTGAVLLSRALIEGQYREAILHAPIVIAVTVLACLLAVRWAVRQFESETVMFRESERFQWSLWFKRIWQDRSDTATANEALLCGMIILCCLFFGRMSMAGQELTWPSLARSTIATQIAMFLAPCLIMALFTTASLRKAFRIERVGIFDVVASLIVGVCFHPSYIVLATAVQREFEIGPDTKALLQQVDGMIADAPLPSVLLVLAMLPALCEELAFRGYIFGGLSRQNGNLRAILVSALFFGFSHGVLQQSISATFMGLILGFIAWRSGGVLCGILVHMTHNGLTMIVSRLGKHPDSVHERLPWMFEMTSEGQLAYTTLWLVSSFVIAVACLTWFAFRPSLKSRERTQPLNTVSTPSISIR